MIHLNSPDIRQKIHHINHHTSQFRMSYYMPLHYLRHNIQTDQSLRKFDKALVNLQKALVNLQKAVITIRVCVISIFSLIQTLAVSHDLIFV
jgi:hypothetical protein